MLFIHIKSLPLEKPLDIRAVLEQLSEEVAGAAGVDLEHITATWEFFLPGYYAHGGQAAMQQPRRTHPVLVDLLTPAFYSADSIETLLNAVAQSLARHVGVPADNIFISHRQAQSGAVFDGGEIVGW